MNTATANPLDASATVPARYVIRANNRNGDPVLYWMQTPYEEHGVQYHWATHPCDCTQFDDYELAEKMAAIMNVDHARPTVVSLEVVTREHPTPPATFPFSIMNIPTDAELAGELELESEQAQVADTATEADTAEQEGLAL